MAYPALPNLSLVHDQYLSLHTLAASRFGGTLKGKLLLRSGFDAAGVAVVLAATMGGAASLIVEADAELGRQRLRTALCDFVVVHADESLRILKNEIRRGLPISVCLTAEPEATLAGLAERGVQPDLLAATDAGGIFAERGAIPLPPQPLLVPGTSMLSWSGGADAARILPEISVLASECLDPQDTTTGARRYWLRQSARTLGRAFAGQQCLRMTTAESGEFLARIRARNPATEILRDGELL